MITRRLKDNRDRFLVAAIDTRCPDGRRAKALDVVTRRSGSGGRLFIGQIASIGRAGIAAVALPPISPSGTAAILERPADPRRGGPGDRRLRHSGGLPPFPRAQAPRQAEEAGEKHSHCFPAFGLPRGGGHAAGRGVIAAPQEEKKASKKVKGAG